MHQGYLSFLLDLTGRGENRTVKDSVRLEPAPSQRPATAFQWKIVVDVEGTVVVRGHDDEANDNSYRVLGKARIAGDSLARHRSRGDTPNSFQWKLVEIAVREELARAGDALRAHPTWVEKVEVEDLVDVIVTDEPVVYGTVPDVPSVDAGSERVADEPRRDAPVRPLPRKSKAVFVAAAAAVVVAGTVVAVQMPSKRKAAPPAAMPVRAIDAAIAPVSSATDAPPPTLEQRVATAPDFASALALAQPAMDDSPDTLSPGATLVARYASKKLRWADVADAKETTIGHVLKDPDVERGKRLCTTGTVQSIERRDLEQRKIYVGRLRTAEDDEVAFVVVGSTTDVVKRSKATICGAVIGRAGSAVSLVGMFDLPENRAPIVERER